MTSRKETPATVVHSQSQEQKELQILRENKERRMRSQSGFTLVELIVVVVILGILATASIASYSKFMVKARISNAQSSMSSFKVGIESLLMDGKDITTLTEAQIFKGCGGTDLLLDGSKDYSFTWDVANTWFVATPKREFGGLTVTDLIYFDVIPPLAGREGHSYKFFAPPIYDGLLVGDNVTIH